MANDTVNFAELWEPTEKNKIIRANPAANRLRVGGTGSSKSSDALMEIVSDYLLSYDGIAALWLRRNYGDLEKSTILDLRSFVPQALYKYNDAKHIATFYNGSKLFFGHLQNNNESDLQQYLSAAFPVICIDECGQISGEAYAFLQSRNRINRECKPGPNGKMPRPVMLVCTNPIGPHWPWYRKQFVQHEPFTLPEGARLDKAGRAWIESDGKWHCIYDPDDWQYVHTTLLDNPALMERDPSLYAKLMSLPEDMREKLLFGNLDSVSGQYFDCWDQTLHVVNLRQDPTRIRWQAWQPKWLGWDWGRVHANVVYWMTRAEVRGLNGEYRSKVVVYREMVERGRDNVWMADAVRKASVNLWDGWDEQDRRLEKGEPEKITACWFSHEKFARQMDNHSPADEMTRLMTARGLPAMIRSTTDRGGSASFLYNLLSRGELVVLDTCTSLIEALPGLMRNEDDPEDVKKADTLADDCYDAFRYGLYGMLGKKPTPEMEKVREHASGIEDPLAKFFYMAKNSGKHRSQVVAPKFTPHWMVQK